MYYYEKVAESKITLTHPFFQLRNKYFSPGLRNSSGVDKLAGMDNNDGKGRKNRKGQEVEIVQSDV